MSKPLISVIIPIYNTSQYLGRCIDSLLNQKYKKIEVILVNDGSTDNSLDICKTYKEIDNRILIVDKANGGLASARNAGLDIAKGDFYGFVDSDDYIHPIMYEDLYNALTDNSADISMCGRTIVRERMKRHLFTLENPVVWSGKEAFSKILIWDNIDSSACDKLFKKELFNQIRFPIGMQTEDVYIIPRIISETNSIVHIGKPRYYWFQRDQSITNSFPTLKTFDDMLTTHDHIVQFTKRKYPDLNSHADHFYLKPIFWNVVKLKIFDIRNMDTLLEKKMIREIKSNFLTILLNKHFSAKDRLLVILLYFNIYSAARLLKDQIQTFFKIVR